MAPWPHGHEALWAHRAIWAASWLSYLVTWELVSPRVLETASSEPVILILLANGLGGRLACDLRAQLTLRSYEFGAQARTGSDGL